ncbi:methyltransferase domain-containing protein [Streptomyces sp. B1866]|uniref:methyltransferase domain-containing protein n=1 Tax=Streptomyces sp. B1866 TaxID=3075431 RepID=UPI00288EB0C0|nr:methyltransferase domain-containing protein [Streptomyces sp. B1866]MDT3396183.1 methyltransferase domain-containing protein [Streptomyces sp. B1866]
MTPDWAPAFTAVPRAPFLPDLMWAHDLDTNSNMPVSRADDPETWLAYAEADVPIVTQWDDGDHTGTGPGRLSTSSASMPSLVLSMLKDLDVQPGHKVLEIGTGTGWNAALLAHRAGADNVITMEVDKAVAASARAALRRFGAAVEVVTGDGFLGHPQGAPYDRVIATAGLRTVPYTWVEQTRPGGAIVAPWGTHYSNRDAVARLTVSSDGTSASGPFTRPAQFMKLRDQRLKWSGHSALVPQDVIGNSDQTTTTLTEEEFSSGLFDAAPFAVGLRVRDCRNSPARKRDGTRPVWFYGLSDRSWAVVIFQDGAAENTVYQSGSRRLWDESEAAYRWWEEQGKPGYDRFGLTVDPEGHKAWLDTPANVLAPVS